MRNGKPLLILAATGALALSAGAAPALAATYTMNLSAPPTAVVGRPMIIQAFGIDPPPAEYWNASWIEVVAIPTSLTSSCPPSGEEGTSVAESGGGEILAISMSPTQDEAGNFSNQIGFTPWAPEALLICGYTDDGAGLTLASAAITLDVQPAAPPPGPTPAPAPGPAPVPPSGTPPSVPPPTTPAGARPASVAKPRVTRSGKTLTCNPGRWSNHPSAYAFGWLVDGKPKHGAATRKLGVTHKQRGRTVRCSVKASNAAGDTTALSRPLRIR